MILMGSLLLPLSWLQEPAKTQVPEAPYIEREEKQFNFFPGGKLEITAGVTRLLSPEGSVMVILAMVLGRILPLAVLANYLEHPPGGRASRPPFIAPPEPSARS